MATDHYNTPELSAVYLAYRPTYPKELYETILKYLDKESDEPVSIYNLAVDVGCGTGQLTAGLAPYFNKVLGVDISKSQVIAADTDNVKPFNVEYRVGSFNNLHMVETGSVDVVASAAAAHWFKPIEDFYKEVDRVLKPGGVLALVSYGMAASVKCDDCDDDQLTGLAKELLYVEGMETDPGWIMTREVLSKIKDLVLPYDKCERHDNMMINKTISLADYLAYLRTWSFYRKYLEAHPNVPDPMDKITKKCQDLIGQDRTLEDTFAEVTWPILLVLGRK